MSQAAALLSKLDYLDEEDCQTLAMALLTGEHPRALSTGEITAFCDWCQGQLISAVMVGMLLRKELVASWSAEQDEWVFRKP